VKGGDESDEVPSASLYSVASDSSKRVYGSELDRITDLACNNTYRCSVAGGAIQVIEDGFEFITL
jgi:hypothetical protein